MSGHTLGEWKAWKAPTGEWTVRAEYRDEQDRRVTSWPAVCNCGVQDNEANAHLMAASKEMLEACKAFVRKVDAGKARSTESYLQMKAAIAAAEGKS